MKYERFEDLPAWVDSKEFVIQIYSVLNDCNYFGFKD
jgi:hypothetical protein